MSIKEVAIWLVILGVGYYLGSKNILSGILPGGG